MVMNVKRRARARPLKWPDQRKQQVVSKLQDGGQSTQNTPPLAQFSYRKPGRVLISSSIMWRKFVTPANVSGRGFSGAVYMDTVNLPPDPLAEHASKSAAAEMRLT